MLYKQEKDNKLSPAQEHWQSSEKLQITSRSNYK